MHIQWNIILTNNNKVLPFVTTWVDLESFM